MEAISKNNIMDHLGHHNNKQKLQALSQGKSISIIISMEFQLGTSVTMTKTANACLLNSPTYLPSEREIPRFAFKIK